VARLRQNKQGEETSQFQSEERALSAFCRAVWSLPPNIHCTRLGKSRLEFRIGFIVEGIWHGEAHRNPAQRVSST